MRVGVRKKNKKAKLAKFKSFLSFVVCGAKLSCFVIENIESSTDIELQTERLVCQKVTVKKCDDKLKK